MEKRYIIALARKIIACRPLMVHKQWLIMIEQLANFCAEQNPKFKRQKFMDFIDNDNR